MGMATGCVKNVASRPRRIMQVICTYGTQQLGMAELRKPVQIVPRSIPLYPLLAFFIHLFIYFAMDAVIILPMHHFTSCLLLLLAIVINGHCDFVATMTTKAMATKAMMALPSSLVFTEVFQFFLLGLTSVLGNHQEVLSFGWARVGWVCWVAPHL